MCRSIQVLHRAEEPATADEVRAAALQFVRKISGYRQPSKANTEVFERAVEDVEAAMAALLAGLEPRRPSRPRSADVEERQLANPRPRR